MKTEFVARVSHELKTPLASIRLFAEMLESGRVADEAKRERYHRVILTESERLTRLIERVLGFARMERGEPVVAPRPDSIEEIVRETVASFDAPGSDADPVTVEMPSLPPALVDRDALAQMLWNLLDNARKYSDGGPVRVEATADAGSVRIRVIDRGPGIPVEERDRVFERFRRGAGDLTRGVGGVGLGLSIASHLARAHGGAIELWSEPGSGSCFTIRLPLAGPAGVDSAAFASTEDDGMTAGAGAGVKAKEGAEGMGQRGNEANGKERGR